jgi:molybdopterin synthase sulfur carrier subunit
MTITLRYFASVREAVGTGSEQIDLPTGAETVGALRAVLVARGGVWADALGSHKLVRMACNQQACSESTPVSDGAEVAFFPPVTGG